MVDLSYIKPQHLWYIIGLITTDGNLSKDGRHISITAKDRNYLFRIKRSLKLNNKIGLKSNGIRPKEKIFSVLQIGDKKFYNFLLNIGLMPNKSIRLGSLNISPDYFADFLRGVIDGDGNISSWIHNTNKNQQWSLRITSGAINFVNWLKKEIEKKFKVKGKMYSYKYFNKNNFIHHIKFGKFASKIILGKCYYKNCLTLNRKFKKARECLKVKNGLVKYGRVVLI